MIHCLELPPLTLGAAGKWRIIADLNGIVNPDNIRVGQRLQLPEEVNEVASVVNTAAGVKAAGKERVRISVENKVVYATLPAKPEKVFVGRTHRKGLYRIGLQEPETLYRQSSGKIAGSKPDRFRNEGDPCHF